ncbi:hypothetical protein AOLI_G00042780 [Acnodon oligacanthus]
MCSEPADQSQPQISAPNELSHSCHLTKNGKKNPELWFFSFRLRIARRMAKSQYWLFLLVSCSRHRLNWVPSGPETCTRMKQPKNHNRPALPKDQLLNLLPRSRASSVLRFPHFSEQTPRRRGRRDVAAIVRALFHISHHHDSTAPIRAWTTSPPSPPDPDHQRRGKGPERAQSGAGRSGQTGGQQTLASYPIAANHGRPIHSSADVGASSPRPPTGDLSREFAVDVTSPARDWRGGTRPPANQRAER